MKYCCNYYDTKENLKYKKREMIKDKKEKLNYIIN